MPRGRGPESRLGLLREGLWRFVDRLDTDLRAQRIDPRVELPRPGHVVATLGIFGCDEEGDAASCNAPGRCEEPGAALLGSALRCAVMQDAMSPNRFRMGFLAGSETPEVRTAVAVGSDLAVPARRTEPLLAEFRG